jgi:hypothetical protein
MKSILCTDVTLLSRKTKKTQNFVCRYKAVIPKQNRCQKLKFEVKFISNEDITNISDTELIQQVMLALSEIKF